MKLIYQKISKESKEKARKKAGSKFLKILQDFDVESSQMKETLVHYQKKLRTDHMLYFCICFFCKVLNEIDELDGTTD